MKFYNCWPKLKYLQIVEYALDNTCFRSIIKYQKVSGRNLAKKVRIFLLVTIFRKKTFVECDEKPKCIILVLRIHI